MYVNQHVSEVPDRPVVECTTASVLEVCRAVTNGLPEQPPATAAEREALRAASGASDTGGANIPQLVAGAHRRYGITLDILSALPDLAAMPNGTFLAVQGNMHAVPAHLKRWDPAFGARRNAWHCVDVYKLGALMWCDPLAPWGAYTGEPVTPAVVRAYFAALPGARIARGILRVPKAHTLHIAAGANVTHYALSSAGCLAGTRTTNWKHDSTAPCGEPRVVPGCSSGSATVVHVTAGAFAGREVRLSPGVTVVEA